MLAGGWGIPAIYRSLSMKHVKKGKSVRPRVLLPDAVCQIDGSHLVVPTPPYRSRAGSLTVLGTPCAPWHFPK